MKATACKQGHPLTADNLYTGPTGLLRGCLVCKRGYAKKHYQLLKQAKSKMTAEELEIIKEQDRQWFREYRKKKPQSVIYKDWRKQYEQREDVKPKMRARYKLRNTIKAGKLARGNCEVDNCSITPTDGHHDDYDKPLDVRWLCRKHHSELHNTVQQEK